MKTIEETQNVYKMSADEKTDFFEKLLNKINETKNSVRDNYNVDDALRTMRLNSLSANEELIQEQLEISHGYMQDLLSSKVSEQMQENEIKHTELNQVESDISVVDLKKETAIDKNPPKTITNEIESNKKVLKILDDLGIKERDSLFQEYHFRLMSHDYITAFKLLTARINSIPDEEDYQELEEFFQDYKHVLRKAAEKDVIHKFAICFSDFLQNVQLSEKNKELLIYLFPIGAMSLCFSSLVSTGALSKADVLKPFINNNLDAYPNVLKDLISQNKIEALDYLLSNTVNINFNNNEIMNLLMGLSSHEKIYYFFEKYNLDINTRLSCTHHNPNVLAPEWNTLFARIVDSKNFPLFEKILDTSSQRPEMSVFLRKDDKIKHYSVFCLLGNSTELTKYILKALEYKYITNNEINGILSLIMQNPQILFNSINAGVVDKLFDHPNLKTVSFIDGTVHLFGFLSCADFWCKNNFNSVVFDSLKYVLHKFIQRFPDVNTLPVGVSVNVYGSTVYLLENNKEPRLLDLLTPILTHYRAWVNVENPCGKTPIELVYSNKALLDILVRLGAVHRKKSVLSKLAFWKKDNSLNDIDFSPRSVLNSSNEFAQNINTDSESSTKEVNDVEKELKDSFNRVRPKLKKLPLDIRLDCESLFLNAESLLLVTDDAEKGKFNEDIFFLVQTFNDYLPSILDTYLASIDLDFINSEKEHANKEDKEEVLKQIRMLDSHIKKLKSNIEMKMKKNLNLDIRKNTEFLKERLGVNDETHRLDDIDTQILKNTENNKDS